MRFSYLFFRITITLPVGEGSRMILPSFTISSKDRVQMCISHSHASPQKLPLDFITQALGSLDHIVKPFGSSTCSIVAMACLKTKSCPFVV